MQKATITNTVIRKEYREISKEKYDELKHMSYEDREKMIHEDWISMGNQCGKGYLGHTLGLHGEMYYVCLLYDDTEEEHRKAPAKVTVVDNKGKELPLIDEVVNNFKAGVPTLVIDTEMSDEQYFIKLLSHITDIEYEKIDTGNLSDDENKFVELSREGLKNAPLQHIYKGDLNMDTTAWIHFFNHLRVLLRGTGGCFVYLPGEALSIIPKKYEEEDA